MDRLFAEKLPALSVQLEVLRQEIVTVHANALILDEKNRNHGVLVADPATRPDGSPIQAGDEYFNSTIERKKIYIGATWIVPDIEAAKSAEAAHASEEAAATQAGLAASAKAQAEAAQVAAEEARNAALLGQAAGVIGKDTLANLNADLAHAVGVV
ncbi:hypothetical protein, partial [Massilia varians]|uniref:hypothetical protein n=1 Tax=Massilia varians TaxID=457921 RepID=UPI00361F9C85